MCFYTGLSSVGSVDICFYISAADNIITAVVLLPSVQ